jgi:hypothetical protein
LPKRLDGFPASALRPGLAGAAMPEAAEPFPPWLLAAGAGPRSVDAVLAAGAGRNAPVAGSPVAWWPPLGGLCTGMGSAAAGVSGAAALADLPSVPGAALACLAWRSRLRMYAQVPFEAVPAPSSLATSADARPAAGAPADFSITPPNPGDDPMPPPAIDHVA